MQATLCKADGFNFYFFPHFSVDFKYALSYLHFIAAGERRGVSAEMDTHTYCYLRQT